MPKGKSATEHFEAKKDKAIATSAPWSKERKQGVSMMNAQFKEKQRVKEAREEQASSKPPKPRPKKGPFPTKVGPATRMPTKAPMKSNKPRGYK